MPGRDPFLAGWGWYTPPLFFKAIFYGFRAKTNRPATRNSQRATLVSDKDGRRHAKGR